MKATRGKTVCIANGGLGMGSKSSSRTNIRALPRYQVIKKHILDQITSGAIQPDDKTESENELASRFNVSRLTVQRAIRDLVAEGYLKRMQGAGTFVADRPNHFSLFEVRDLAEEARMRGAEPETDVLVQRRIVPDERVRTLLELAPEVPTYQAVLLQKADSAPLAIEERFARCDVFPDFLEQDFQSQSVYAYFARHSALGEIETILHAVIPSRQYRQWLDIEEGEPALFLERRNRYKGKIVTLTRFTYAGSDFSLGSKYVPTS